MEHPKSRIERFYDATAEAEWARLDRHKMEFATTWRAMEEHVPAGSKILDVGGGPGRYSISLARAGHHVTLLDLSAANVALAGQKAGEAGVPLDGCVQGNALDLSRFPDASFDVVLLMGPLYHLLDEAARHQAVREATRVLRNDGLLFAAYITRYAILFDVLKHGPAEITSLRGVCDGILASGVDIPYTDDSGFTDAYFAVPTEIEPFMVGHGLTTVRLAGAEGIIAAAEPAVNALPADLFAWWADLCYRLGTDPVTWGAAEHMLYVGRKSR